MGKRVGIRDGESYYIEQLANEGYSQQEVSDYLQITEDVIKAFWPAQKKSTRTKKVANDG